MHVVVKTAYKSALVRTIDCVKTNALHIKIAQRRWLRETNKRGWKNYTYEAPDWQRISWINPPALDCASKDFIEAFKQHHANHFGMIGVSGGVQQYQDAEWKHVVFNSVQELWKRHNTLELKEEFIDEIVSEFSAFVDSDEMGLIYKVTLGSLAGCVRGVHESTMACGVAEQAAD
jgi:hypothetical protein